MRDKFIGAVHSCSKIQLIFYLKEDNAIIMKLATPMDFGLSRRAHDKDDRFHFWDYESDKKNHVLSSQPEAIKSLVVAVRNFRPQEFVN